MSNEFKGTHYLNQTTQAQAFTDMGASPFVPANARFDYVAVPRREDLYRQGIQWRVLLIPVGVGRRPIALQVHGDTVLGVWTTKEALADVDLSTWGGHDAGISRRHVTLRPSRTNLFIIDMGSTNGTHINGMPLGQSWAHALRDDDIITLSTIHMRLRIVQRPE